MNIRGYEFEIKGCIAISFDDLEEAFQHYLSPEQKRFNTHLEIYPDGIVIEYYDPDDYEGKCPYMLDNEDLLRFISNMFGLRPELIIPFGDKVYFIN